MSSENLQFYRVTDEYRHGSRARFMEIIRGWREQGLLLKQSRQARLQEPIKPNISSKSNYTFFPEV